ncbi:hypothetical protein VTJ04DRAFT_9518 [Mycothermus thermophilus]|uniref:uncharacterized protein n=1 Tax=Humicola insolens TaxID=85995 RepID=UPI00374407CD
MKVSAILACLFGIVAALPSVPLEAKDSIKRTTSGKSFGLSLRSGASLPQGLTITTVTPTVVQSRAGLEKLPISHSSRKRRQLEPGPADFFECRDSTPRPSTADCKFIVDYLLASDDEFIIAANSCLAFSYRTCQGFFCSLCETLFTTTQFMGSQLDTVDALCVENGQAGTIVGEHAPQWEAGFTYTGQPVPAFDVC